MWCKFKLVSSMLTMLSLWYRSCLFLDLQHALLNFNFHFYIHVCCIDLICWQWETICLPEREIRRNQCQLKTQCRHANHDSIQHHRCYLGVRLLLCRVLHFHFHFHFFLLKFHLLLKKALINLLAWLYVISHFLTRIGNFLPLYEQM